MCNCRRRASCIGKWLQEFAARYYQFGGTDSIRVGVAEIGQSIPRSFSLSQNYPNPFNPTTRIEYALPSVQKVVLKLYDILGREVRTMVNEQQTPGVYRVDLNAGSLASGVYFYRLEAGQFVQVRRMLVLK